MRVRKVVKRIAIGVVLTAVSMTAEGKTKVTSQPFGKMPDGTPVELYTLSDGAFEAQIATYGGIVVSLKAPDRNGKSADVVLGFDDVDGYLTNFNGPSDAFFGAIIGRYANRIAHGSFTLNGQKVSLPKNNGENTLHGGPHGFNNVVWKAKPVANGVELTYLSKDGEAGFPGNLTAAVVYTLEKGDLRIEYSATSDKSHRGQLDQSLLFQSRWAGRHSEPSTHPACVPLHTGGCWTNNTGTSMISKSQEETEVS